MVPRRAAPAPPLVRFDPAGTGEELAAAGVELLVVDTPPGQPPYLGQLLGLADVVLVPVRPTQTIYSPRRRSPAASPGAGRGPSCCPRCRPGPG